MTLRTTQKDVTFQKPFSLAGLEEVLPAGVYVVDTEEELIEGLSFTAYQRTNTTIHLQPKSADSAIKRSMTLSPTELEAALLRDMEAPSSILAGERAPTLMIEAGEETEHRVAHDRANDDGMAANSHDQR